MNPAPITCSTPTASGTWHRFTFFPGHNEPGQLGIGLTVEVSFGNRTGEFGRLGRTDLNDTV